MSTLIDQLNAARHHALGCTFGLLYASNHNENLSHATVLSEAQEAVRAWNTWPLFGGRSVLAALLWHWPRLERLLTSEIGELLLFANESRGLQINVDGREYDSYHQAVSDLASLTFEVLACVKPERDANQTNTFERLVEVFGDIRDSLESIGDLNIDVRREYARAVLYLKEHGHTFGTLSEPQRETPQPTSNEPARLIAELERQTPLFSRDIGEWVSNKKAAELEGLKVATLKDYRYQGIANEQQDLGQDPEGRIWRRQGTPNSHPWYLRSSLLTQRAKGKS